MYKSQAFILVSLWRSAGHTPAPPTLTRSRGCVQQAAPQDASPPKYHRDRFSAIGPASVWRSYRGSLTHASTLTWPNWPAECGWACTGARKKTSLNSLAGNAGAIWRDADGSQSWTHAQLTVAAANRNELRVFFSVFLKWKHPPPPLQTRGESACLFKRISPPKTRDLLAHYLQIILE